LLDTNFGLNGLAHELLCQADFKLISNVIWFVFEPCWKWRNTVLLFIFVHLYWIWLVFLVLCMMLRYAIFFKLVVIYAVFVVFVWYWWNEWSWLF